MGGRKLRLGVHRKNWERQQRERKNAMEAAQDPQELRVALPITAFLNGIVDTVQALSSRLDRCEKPPMWVSIADHDDELAYKLKAPETIELSIFVQQDMSWVVTVCHQQLHSVVFSELPKKVNSVSTLLQLLFSLSKMRLCPANTEGSYLELWERQLSTLHGSSVSSKARIDKVSVIGLTSIRHVNCRMLLSATSKEERCRPCTALRESLRHQSRRRSADTSGTGGHHCNLRYKTIPELVHRVKEVQHQYCLLSKRHYRLKQKIAQAAERAEVVVDEELHDDLVAITTNNATVVEKEVPANSFHQIFWQQQVEAASRNDSRGMRWHPLMVRFCLYLQHRSSGTYESLRSSGCIRLPSQRTLRDYTHYIEAKSGFSHEVDAMLFQTAKVDTCPEREKYVLLLLDEMHIREDIVYNKHTGTMIGYANLGDINKHLLQFESSISSGDELPFVPAKTIMVFMVRGLFNSLQFPFAQFPVAELSGELLYDPFWEAVMRLENIGLKVMGATLDGNAVNRRLLKLHDYDSELVYKTTNPYADRQFFFFSDPPHLLKTARNCWYSKTRRLWCNGKEILWGHLTELYTRDTAGGEGVRMVPKIKFEHISLTSFSKMRVDLAAQVFSDSVSKALSLTGGADASETAIFVGMMDKFFDCLNVHNYTSGVHSRKPFQMPYTSASDFRLKWLEQEFLGYLKAWEKSVEERVNFTQGEKANMLLSPATRLGIFMTCKSFVELVRFLFTITDVKSFLSQRICQDPLERFFGLQRQRGGVHDNPNTLEFFKNTQALRVIKGLGLQFASKRGNCRGGVTDDENSDINAPLPKRRRCRKLHVRAETI